MLNRFLAVALLLLLFSIAAPRAATAQHPLENDPTGINWVFSLEDARNVAKEHNKIVLLKPVAFRSQEDNDRLSPSAEALRAVTLVDQRVVNLLNRRFVPYYFDMDSLGSEYDQEAAKLAIKLYPDMRYLQSMPTPPLLFMSPEGKMLGHASNFLTADEMLEKLGEVINENSRFLTLSTEEQAVTDPIEKAMVYYELRQLDKAIVALDGQQSSESFYLRGLIAREREDWPEMKTNFRMVTDAHRVSDVSVENGIRYWKIRNLDGIIAKFKDVQADNPRYQEIMYYLGLAYYHTDDADKAIEVWTGAVEADLTTTWAMRLDWTIGLAKLGPGQYLSPYDRQPSLLGRRYMAPAGNPDLVINQ